MGGEGLQGPQREGHGGPLQRHTPIELIRCMLSRQATLRKHGLERKTMCLDDKKAHVAPKCEQEVYVEVPEEAGVRGGRVLQAHPLVVWLSFGGPGLE